FSDPHTELIEHLWKAGSCPTCDDIVPEHNVGLKEEECMDSLKLAQGKKYYSTITVCNQAGLCVSSSTDGVTIDSSPPVAGVVEDGTLADDIEFQASRDVLSAHWVGFHDAHSGLSRYEMRVGTNVGADDIIPPTQMHLTESTFKPLSTPLPENKTIYVTIRAYNLAGLYAEASSNGFRVDTTSPTVIEPASINLEHGSIQENMQVWRSSLAVTWKFDDNISSIERQYVSIFAHMDGDLEIPTVEVGTRVGYIFSNLTLRDGTQYYTTVIACNKAQMCSSSTSQQLLVDSSRPSVGTFASWTNHAANVGRYEDGFMTWNGADISLHWLGFEDHHSGISHYLVTVGETFAGHEYTPDGPIMITHNTTGHRHKEGVIQSADITLDRTLVDSKKIFVKIWAVNGVGLPSLVAHNSFDVIVNSPGKGVLVLTRRCITHSCEGHCICAPQNQRCDYNINKTCTEAKQGDYAAIVVNDTQAIGYFEKSDHILEDIDFTHSDCFLAAGWSLSERNGKTPVRYEYTAGLDGYDVGSGVFDVARDRIWFEAGFYNHAVITPTLSRLYQGQKYIFYVRAWYNDSTYAVFQSDGITIDITPPMVSRIRHVEESDDAIVRFDKDFTSNVDSIGVSWTGVFSDEESGISHYLLGIGTALQDDDTLKFLRQTKTSARLTELSLTPGQKYYTTVIAVSNTGLETSKVSDGFTVDIESPIPGIVLDGRFLHDVDYTNETTVLHAQWH
ncbi:unnamed protein product, partial [Owenia fusiformis]